jgi:very-short-patch-repair endonuclease
LNDFETDVFDALTAKGLKLVPQFGASQFRIDMVASHPRKPGRLVLAIECDGATYHSSCTARDRDRLRQQQLENLGWRFHRIWSTDWFMRKAEEVERTIRSFETAVDHADKLDSAQLTNGTGGNIEPSPQPNCNGAERKRGSRPPIPIRPSIAEYTTAELVELVRWVCSDGQLRTDDEIISDMVSAMSFSRRGARIEARIRMAIPLGRERSQG